MDKSFIDEVNIAIEKITTLTSMREINFLDSIKFSDAYNNFAKVVIEIANNYPDIERFYFNSGKGDSNYE